MKLGVENGFHSLLGSAIEVSACMCACRVRVEYYTFPDGIKTQLKNRGNPFGDRTNVIRIVACH
jgi:hypothetical protein